MHVLVLLAAGLALCFGESINLTCGRLVTSCEGVIYDLYYVTDILDPKTIESWIRVNDIMSENMVGTAGNRFARDDKEPGPSWGKQLPGERPRETAET